MTAKLQTFFSNSRNIIISGGVVISVLLIAVIALLISLLNDPATSTKTANDNSSTSQEGNFSGHTSKLSGMTTSYRNLKGLTLRINQIDTCDPDEISAYVSVSSDEGVVSKNFSKQDVKIYLDGKQVSNFEFKAVDTARLPLANMLVIDHSGSMKGSAMDNAKAAASSYIDKLKNADKTGLIQFNDRIDLLASMTTDKAKVKSAIAGMTPSGNTAIYDALSQATKEVPNCGRKAITVLTDGDDTASKNATQKSVTTLANQNTLPIFAVGIKGEGFNAAAIRAIAEGTGGQYLEANTPAEIAALYDRIDGQLTGQFAANLKLSIKKDGSAHTLKIVSNVEGSETGSERQFVY